MASPPDPGRPPPDLLERLRPLADARGVVRFDRFMEVVLYGEGVGYYARPDRSPFGPRGDFYTAPSLHPLFAGTLALRVLEEHARLGRPRRFRVVEVGPGDGTLAIGLVQALSPQVPEEARWEYVLVERSAARRAGLERSVRDAAASGRIDVSSVDSLGAAGPFSGVVLANELLDALPCRRLVWREGTWRELGVRLDPAALGWAEAGPAAPVPSPPLPDGPREGAILEVGVAAEAFLREVGDHLTEGGAFFLDYGLEEDELLRGHPAGTLSALYRHTQLENRLAFPGSADLSAFVNFTRVRSAARSAGLREVAFRRQAEALVAWGLPRLLEAAGSGASGDAADVKLRLAAKSLLFGFENFRVLELAAGDPG